MNSEVIIIITNKLIIKFGNKKRFPYRNMLKFNPKSISSVLCRQLAMFSESQSTTKGYQMPARDL